MHLTKDNRGNHQQQRNITPNFLRFKKKSIGKQSNEPMQSNANTQRSSSKPNKCSFDVYQKRVLHLSKLKNTLTVKSGRKDEKEKQSSIDPSKKKRQGLQITTRRNNSNNKQEEEKALTGRRKVVASGSNKNISVKEHQRNDSNNSQRTSHHDRSSIPKRSQDSLEKEQQRAKLQNIQFLNNLLQQPQPPNYMNKLKMKKLQQKQKEKKATKKRFLSCEIEIHLEEELKNYQIFDELGKGAYGVVKMGLNRKSNEKVAIKIYDKKRLDQPNKIKNLQREINILAKLDHPMIAKLIEVVETPFQIYLVLEYGGANSLYNYLLSKPQHRLSQTQTKTFFKSISQTLGYLHSRGIVHRDIKAENILLNRNKQLKLIDFGFSLQTMPPSTIDTFCGTPTYMAPEIVSKRDHVAVYTDMWSLGILLYVMLQGNYPFRAKSEIELFQRIKQGQFEYLYQNISQKSKKMIQGLLRVNPLQRMTITDVNQDVFDWFNSQAKDHAAIITNFTTNST